jgi:hypothetical protein
LVSLISNAACDEALAFEKNVSKASGEMRPPASPRTWRARRLDLLLVDGPELVPHLLLGLAQGLADPAIIALLAQTRNVHNVRHSGYYRS